MVTPGKLELAVTIRELPVEVKTIKDGWKQFDIDLAGQVITLTLKPEVFDKLKQAQEDYPQWTAKIVGQMQGTPDRGFFLKDCRVNIAPQSSHLFLSSNTKLRSNIELINDAAGNKAKMCEMHCSASPTPIPSVLRTHSRNGERGYDNVLLSGELGSPHGTPQDAPRTSHAGEASSLALSSAGGAYVPFQAADADSVADRPRTRKARAGKRAKRLPARKPNCIRQSQAATHSAQTAPLQSAGSRENKVTPLNATPCKSQTSHYREGKYRSKVDQVKANSAHQQRSNAQKIQAEFGYGRRSSLNYSSTLKYSLNPIQQLGWLSLIIKLRQSICSVVLPWGVFFGGYSLVICILNNFGFAIGLSYENNAITRAVLIFSIALFLLLVLRANNAYKRFWQGRKLWEVLANNIYYLARGIWVTVKERSPQEREEKEAILRLTVAFAVALKLHLRAKSVNQELALLMSDTQYLMIRQTNHPAIQIVLWIENYLQCQYERDCLKIEQLNSLYKPTNTLLDIFRGCEQLLKTSSLSIYSFLLNKLVLIYCLILPFVLVKNLTWLTAATTVFISFILISIEQIGSKIEQPFSKSAKNLPLDAICKTILRKIEDLIAITPSSDDSIQLKL